MEKAPGTFTTVQKEFHLPVEYLLVLLRSKGFSVKPDDYIEILKVIEKFGSENFDETAQYLCPLIATNETEQAKFYRVIEEYKLLDQRSKNDQRSFKRFWKWILPGSLLLFITLGVYIFKDSLFSPKPDTPFLAPYAPQVIRKGDTLKLMASGYSSKKVQENQQLSWEFEKDVIKHGTAVTHVFQHTGQYIIKRKFQPANYPVTEDSIWVYVCNDIPKVSITVPGQILTKQTITFNAAVTAKQGTIQGFQWRIDTAVFITSEPLLTHRFDTTGYYRIECIAIVKDTASICSKGDAQTVHVVDPGVHYELQISQQAVTLYGGQTELRSWVTLLLLIPAGAGLAYGLIKRKRKKNRREYQEEEQKDNSINKNKPPYQIPFERNDLRLVKQEKNQRSMFLQMRQKAEEETVVLSVAKSIDTTIRSGGLPSLVYLPRLQQQQYIVLIDRSNPKNLMPQLFEYLVLSMADANIPVERFYYDQEFRCYHDHFPLGITLQRLVDLYPSANVLIMGKAHELVYRAYPLIEEQFLHELNRWQHVAIITPASFPDWGEKEKVLASHLILLPADIEAIQQVIPALKENMHNARRYLVAHSDLWYTTQYVDFRDINEIRTYVDNEVLFQWLCALSVFPKLRWELLVEIGNVLLQKYGQEEKMNYSTLLKLCRIQWMQEGVIPQSTRMDLLKHLEIENEVIARQIVLRLLNQVQVLYGGGYFFDEENERQQLTNEFILYAHDQLQFHDYAGSEKKFQKLWETNALLDAPLKKYLDKKESDTWETPISNGKKSIGLRQYFNLEIIKVQKKIQYRRIAAVTVSLLLISFWIYLSQWAGAHKPGIPQLYKVNTSQNIPFSLKVHKDFRECGDSSNSSFDNLTGILTLGKQLFEANYNKNETMLAFSIPYADYIKGNGILLLNWGSDQTLEQPLALSLKNPTDNITVLCRKITARDTTLITKQVTNNTAVLKLLNGYWSGRGVQYDNNESWQMHFTCNINKNLFAIEYPGLCTGSWELKDVSNNEVTFIEHISVGLKKCTDSGTVKIRIINKGTLLYYYYPVNSSAILAKGELTKGDAVVTKKSESPSNNLNLPNVVTTASGTKLTDSLRTEYTYLWNDLTINKDKISEVNAAVATILTNKSRYEMLSSKTGVPWNVIAILHFTESALSFNRHLHNGDPLTDRTTHIPVGRPATGNPPFTWEESAVDALTMFNFNTWTDWSITGILYKFENVNGFGYRGRGINSPYLWAGSNNYQKGKYTSQGMFDPNAISNSIGAAVLLKALTQSTKEQAY